MVDFVGDDDGDSLWGNYFGGTVAQARPASPLDGALDRVTRLQERLKETGAQNRQDIADLYAPQYKRWEDATRALEAQRVGPSRSELMFQLAAAMAKPTSYQGFGASLENIAPVLQAYQGGVRSAENERSELLSKYGIGRGDLAREEAKMLFDLRRGEQDAVTAEMMREPRAPGEMPFAFDQFGEQRLNRRTGEVTPVRGAPAQGASVPVISTDAEYAALPSGAVYQVRGESQPRRKP